MYNNAVSPTPSPGYTYSHGVPKPLVWFVHIVMGIFFAYLGYEMVTKYKELPNFYTYGLLLLVVGSIITLYHSSLWMAHASSPPPPPKIERYCGCS